MASLPTELRSQLAKVIQEARREAEAGARKALEALAIDREKPHGSMAQEQAALRNRLRAHGRQLGDVRDRTRGTQEIGRLAHEVAYEHWHRMLFARFLAENQLLIERNSGVAISMTECEELARERNEDPWGLAASFAERMLPRIFRPDDPALQVALAPETRQALERLLESLPAPVFTSDDALGWTYQFWQAERKGEVNASGRKIGADELPAVTQLFTEHYMVLFLFHNTIGAWRAEKILAERAGLAEDVTSEGELRQAVRLSAEGGYDFSYLRFVREAREGGDEGKPTGPWRPAAGVFEGWPRTAAEFRVLDPCCGSGHFLVEGFELLVRLRREEEGLALDDAIRAVLSENLFGLEIDPRCTQIAAFNLALTAWKLAGRFIELPTLQIACSGLAPNSTKQEWLTLAEQAAAAGGMPVERDLFRTEDTLLSLQVRGGLSALHALFQQAPELGSLIDPRALEADLLQADFASVQPLLAAVLERERANDEQVERAVAAQGMARAAELLAGQYTLVITNVPYLGRSDQSDSLKAFAQKHHKEAKGNLATTFVSRIFDWLGRFGTAAVVAPQNWLFLTTYTRLRERLLTHRTWDLVARLGVKAFQTPMWDQNIMLVSLSAQPTREGHLFGGIDVAEEKDPSRKAAVLRGETGIIMVPQTEQLENPDAMITLARASSVDRLGQFARSYQGLKTGDDARFRRCFWETAEDQQRWRFYQSTVEATSHWGGLYYRVDAADGDNQWARPQGKSAWGRTGVAISQMSELPVALFTGAIFDSNMTSVVPFDPPYLPAIWCLCSDSSFTKAVRAFDQSLKVPNASFEKVPFDLSHWEQVAAEKYPNGLPEPQSDDPTQWLFHGHPAKTEPRAALQVAVARLLGYRWPTERDPEMRLAAEARAWVERCREFDAFADDDGIVCLTATRGEAGAADRLRRLLAAAFGSEWSGAREHELLAAASEGGKPAASLEEWLRDCFFEEHCKLFHHRPFVWHVWDGRKDGFHALVSYHRLAGPDGEGRRTLQALAYSYLGDWITRQKAEQREGKEGADARLAAAQDLQAQLERILAGEPPCDLFVRWKPLHRQPVGWEPDINDGVRLNIRPFLSAELRSGGRKGAGLLRWKPNISWSKDRGNEPRSLRPREDFPWFWSCAGDGTLADRTDFPGGPDFDGDRWNDLHYTTARKHAARERSGQEDER